MLLVRTHTELCSSRVSPSRFAQENGSVAHHESAHLPRPPLLLLAQETRAPNSLPNVPKSIYFAWFHCCFKDIGDGERGSMDFVNLFFFFFALFLLSLGKFTWKT